MKRKVIQIVSVIVIVITSISCEIAENDSNLDFKNGIILYMPPPDNCNDYVIKSDDNYWFKPSNLNNDFRIDSLLIRFAFDSTDNFHDCGFGGSIPIIDLIHIEKR